MKTFKVTKDWEYRTGPNRLVAYKKGVEYADQPEAAYEAAVEAGAVEGVAETPKKTVQKTDAKRG